MLRLIEWPFRLAHCAVWVALVICGSKEMMALGLLVGIYLTAVGEWTPGELGRNLMIGFAVGFVCYVPAGVLRPGARPRRGARSRPDPIAVDLSKPADRPTVTQALGRIDPALRRMIATSRAEAGG